MWLFGSLFSQRLLTRHASAIAFKRNISRWIPPKARARARKRSPTLMFTPSTASLGKQERSFPGDWMSAESKTCQDRVYLPRFIGSCRHARARARARETGRCKIQRPWTRNRAIMSERTKSSSRSGVSSRERKVFFPFPPAFNLPSRFPPYVSHATLDLSVRPSIYLSISVACDLVRNEREERRRAAPDDY